MLRRVSVLAIALLLGLGSQPCDAGRRVTASKKEVTLNKGELAALRAALVAMNRLRFYESALRRWQVVISDEGSIYNVAFMRDPVRDISDTEGCAWDVRKRDMKVIKGPILYR